MRRGYDFLFLPRDDEMHACARALAHTHSHTHTWDGREHVPPSSSPRHRHHIIHLSIPPTRAHDPLTHPTKPSDPSRCSSALRGRHYRPFLYDRQTAGSGTRSGSLEREKVRLLRLTAWLPFAPPLSKLRGRLGKANEPSISNERTRGLDLAFSLLVRYTPADTHKALSSRGIRHLVCVCVFFVAQQRHALWAQDVSLQRHTDTALLTPHRAQATNTTAATSITTTNTHHSPTTLAALL
jgi:hypothetical protein